jgi:outer membrane protein
VAAQKIEQELQGIQQQLQNGAGKLTPAAEADLQATGQRRQRELQHISEDLQNDVNAERTDILQKASVKMQEIVKQVAEAKGVDMVVDVQTAIYFKPAMEITADVLAAYNKAHPAK